MKHLPLCIRHQFGYQTVIPRKLCQVKEAPDVAERHSLTPCQLYLKLYFEEYGRDACNGVLEDTA